MLRVRIGVVVFALALMGAAFYQEKDKGKKTSDSDPPTKLKGILPQHFKKLGLRDDQVQKIYKLQADYKAKIDDLTRKIEKLKSERREAQEKVLTPEQLKRLKELRLGEKSTD
jgi:uncharacterized protein YeeX (DUF496 family)